MNKNLKENYYVNHRAGRYFYVYKLVICTTFFFFSGENYWNKLSWEEMNFPYIDVLSSRRNAFLEDGLLLITNCMSCYREVCDMQ